MRERERKRERKKGRKKRREGGEEGKNRKHKERSKTISFPEDKKYEISKVSRNVIS